MYRRESIAYAEPLDTSFLLTIPAMQTSTDTSSPAADLLNPLAGWEAAARWNRAAFDWMAKGWQQWFALLTTLPPQLMLSPTATGARAVSSAIPALDPLTPALLTPALHPVTPAKAGAQEARAARSSEGSRLRGNDGHVSARATARAEPKRASRAKPKAKSKKTTIARTRS
jgi:hypothetical protein